MQDPVRSPTAWIAEHLTSKSTESGRSQSLSETNISRRSITVKALLPPSTLEKVSFLNKPLLSLKPTFVVRNRRLVEVLKSQNKNYKTKEKDRQAKLENLLYIAKQVWKINFSSLGNL